MGPRAENHTILMVDSERVEMNVHPSTPTDPLADVDMDWRANRQEMVVQWGQQVEARERWRRHVELWRQRRDKVLLLVRTLICSLV